MTEHTSGSLANIQPPSRRWFALVLLLGLLLRCWGLTSPLYDLNYWRQTETAAIAQNYYQDNLPFLSPEIDWTGPGGRAEMEFPIFPYLISLLYQAFGFWDGFGRILSIFCSLWVVVNLWWIARKLFDDWTALFAAGFFAVAPLAVYFGRTFQPDMMMLAASTACVALLLYWNGKWTDARLYVSALLLALGVALKPTCVLYAPALAVIFYQRLGWKCVIHPKTLIYAALVLGLPALWYWRAHTFYLETGTTFIRHYIDFSFETAFFRFWRDPAYWPIVARRIGVETLVYVGVLFFLIGLKPAFSKQRRWFCLAWLLSVPGLYLGIPGHHYGHHYYSLPAIPVLALFAGAGLAWIANSLRRWLPTGLFLLVPICMGGFGMNYMINEYWYAQLYLYYHDAVDLRDELPEAPIAVFDELNHTPEFFYFANRDGWRRMRNANDWVDDSQWVEQVRGKGAQALVWLNESFANHPIKHLSNHPTGQYVWSHYELQELGYRHFVARYDQPRYGDHAIKPYLNQRVAMPPSAMTQYAFWENLPLEKWSEADALLFDFHLASFDERDEILQTYRDAVGDGFAIIRQDGGRVVLQRSQALKSKPDALDAAAAGHWIEGPTPRERFSFGVVEAGRYRISVTFAEEDLQAPVRIYAMTPDGVVRSHRMLEAEHLPHLQEGERPAIFLNLPQATGIVVGANHDDRAYTLASAVIVPDLECMAPDQVFQAESLYTNVAKVVSDPDADRGTALWGYASEQGRFFCHGPFFQLPDGLYEGGFRLRTPREWSEWDVVVGFHEGNVVWQKVVPMTTKRLPTDYSELTVEAEFPESYVIETRAYLYEDSEVLLDTIRIGQRMRDSVHYATGEAIAELKTDEGERYVSANGVISNASGEYLKKMLFLEGGVAAAAWTPQTGLRVLDTMGRVFDENNRMVWYAPWATKEPIMTYAISADARAEGFISYDGMLYLYESGAARGFKLETRPYPVRKLLIYDGGSAHVLFGNGFVATVGDAEPVINTPDFFGDAARALIKTPQGYYVVDNRGGIHSYGDAPKILTPYYQEIDWIVDAKRDDDGVWTLIDLLGGTHVFNEADRMQ
ncbi:MAG: glycosyltransferase family 39 protein [Candidatus Hinthialibacter antarcticus]|nr:glycosyltransferase family 39 protein [Candidatus Hinthialibacter antarcticus]